MIARSLFLLVPMCALACSSTDDRSQAKDGGAGPPRDAAAEAQPALDPFSFFVTSQRAIVEVSDSSTGFGGDLRFGETGPGAGLRGADAICATIAERSMPGARTKTWRAFLSVAAGEDGAQVDAIDRIGEGPWYDRLGRLVAASTADLLAARPIGADPAIADDLPNEDGIPNNQPDPTAPPVDNHDILTGSNRDGRLFGPTSTCLDWTTTDAAIGGRPRVGHSWPRDFGDIGSLFGDGGFPFPFGGDGGSFLDDILSIKEFDPAHWISSLDEAGCAAGINIIEMGPPNRSNPTVGSGGGYGGFYCFALEP